MFRHRFRICLLFFLGGFGVPGLGYVRGIKIHTTSEMEVVNGTSIKLKCTFSSDKPVSPTVVTVSWNFKPLTTRKQQKKEYVFYYQETPYPPTEGRFLGRVTWAGDIMRKDGSITLKDVTPNFNGTYSCMVENPPDVHGTHGETVLKVVKKVSISEISVLTAIVVGACIFILLVLSVFVLIRLRRKRRRDNNIEMLPEEYEKGERDEW